MIWETGHCCFERRPWSERRQNNEVIPVPLQKLHAAVNSTLSDRHGEGCEFVLSVTFICLLTSRRMSLGSDDDISNTPLTHTDLQFQQTEGSSDKKPLGGNTQLELNLTVCVCFPAYLCLDYFPDKSVWFSKAKKTDRAQVRSATNVCPWAPLVLAWM